MILFYNEAETGFILMGVWVITFEIALVQIPVIEFKLDLWGHRLYL